MTDTTNTEPLLPRIFDAADFMGSQRVCAAEQVKAYGDARAAHAVAQIKARKPFGVDWCVQWLRNNYQDYSHLGGLCDAMLEAAHATAEQPQAREIDALRAELQNIANANPSQWDEDMRDQFQQWAQNRARHALANAPVAQAREITDAEIDAAIPQEIITAMTDAYWLLTKLGPVEDKRYHIVCNLAAAIALANGRDET